MASKNDEAGADSEVDNCRIAAEFRRSADLARLAGEERPVRGIRTFFILCFNQEKNNERPAAVGI
jgi:hypothetical protein